MYKEFRELIWQHQQYQTAKNIFFNIVYEGNQAGQRVGKFVPFTDNGTIANSCIFNSPDSSVLSRTPSGTGTSKKHLLLVLGLKMVD